MYALNRVHSRWLAQVSMLALVFLLVTGDMRLRGSGALPILIPASIAGLFLLFHGLLVAAGDEVPGSPLRDGRLHGFPGDLDSSSASFHAPLIS